MAQFVKSGARIPRRGEVGIGADEIAKLEEQGYVMSGSRHQRMNAIRMRKENQVYTAEEQKALAIYNYEERQRKEQDHLIQLQETLLKKKDDIRAEKEAAAKVKEAIQDRGSA